MKITRMITELALIVYVYKYFLLFLSFAVVLYSPSNTCSLTRCTGNPYMNQGETVLWADAFLLIHGFFQKLGFSQILSVHIRYRKSLRGAPYWH
jgi:hypothetical protein